MPGHLELAILSKQVYFSDGGYIQGWQCTETYSDSQGFGAAVYTNKMNEMVIAFRGTDTGNLHNFLKNIMTNVDIARGELPNTLKNANEYVQGVRGSRTLMSRLLDLLTTRSENQLFLTGHSLGGMLAALVGYHFLKNKNKKYYVVTFENPGIAPYVSPADCAHYAYHFRQYFMTYLVDPNLINTRYPHVGSIRHVIIKPHNSTIFAKGDFYVSHAVDCLVNDLLRILLLLILLNMLMAATVANKALSHNISATTEQLSSFMHQQGYISKLDTNDHSSALFYFFTSIAMLILTKIIKTIYTITSRQHHIDALITEFNKGKGEPANYYNMESWPKLNQYLLSHFQHLLWINPWRNPSMVTIKKPIELHDERVKSIDGYKTSPPVPTARKI